MGKWNDFINRHNINKSQQYWENITPQGDLRYKPSFPSYHGSLPATPALLCDRPGIARPRIPSKGYSAQPTMNSAQLQIIKSNGWASSVTNYKISFLLNMSLTSQGWTTKDANCTDAVCEGTIFHAKASPNCWFLHLKPPLINWHTV